MFYSNKLYNLDNFFNTWEFSKGLKEKINHNVNDKKELEVYFEFAGVKKEDIDIAIEKQLITITGKKQVGKIKSEVIESIVIDSKYNPETVKAKLSEGILTLTFSKNEKEKKLKVLIE